MVAVSPELNAKISSSFTGISFIVPVPLSMNSNVISD